MHNWNIKHTKTTHDSNSPNFAGDKNEGLVETFLPEEKL